MLLWAQLLERSQTHPGGLQPMTSEWHQDPTGGISLAIIPTASEDAGSVMRQGRLRCSRQLGDLRNYCHQGWLDRSQQGGLHPGKFNELSSLEAMDNTN